MLTWLLLSTMGLGDVLQKWKRISINVDSIWIQICRSWLIVGRSFLRSKLFVINLKHCHLKRQIKFHCVKQLGGKRQEETRCHVVLCQWAIWLQTWLWTWQNKVHQTGGDDLLLWCCDVQYIIHCNKHRAEREQNYFKLIFCDNRLLNKCLEHTEATNIHTNFSGIDQVIVEKKLKM